MTSGIHFLQIPGPTNVPARVLSALARPTIDHRGPTFGELVKGLVRDLGRVFQTTSPVLLFPGSGTGAWEAALVNLLSPGDRVLAFETGHFATKWRDLATRFGVEVDFVPGDWRRGVDPAATEEKLASDKNHRYKAVLVVHTETSTGVTSRIPEVRGAMDAAKHPALLLVDAVSSLAADPFLHDAWRVDVTVAGSQKGLMCPPGLGINVVSERALAMASGARLPRYYWDWQPVLEANAAGRFPYTPATNLLFALREAVSMLLEVGMETVWERHHRHGEAVRRAVASWGLETQCADPREHSNSVTAVVAPEGSDPDRLRDLILTELNTSLGGGLGKLRGRVFRIAHLGDFNDLMLVATLAGVEMGMVRAGFPHRPGGVEAAREYLNSAGASR